jgi:hypothetical protein
MAVGMSDKMLEQFGPRHQPKAHLLIRARRLREAVRAVQRKIGDQRVQPCNAPCEVLPTLEACAPHFREHGWAFIDPYYEKTFFGELLAGWPRREFFAPMHNPLKSYDFGFRWLRANPRTDFIERFPALHAAYQMMQSPEMGRRITEICGDGIQRSCYSMTSTWATAGSGLIPHRDSFGTVPHDKVTGGFVNFVVFVDANGTPPHAGGTCILGDNEFKNVIFEPHNLRNTALIYQKEAAFYHGFKPLARGAYRWAIIAEFCDVDFHLGMVSPQ